MIDILVFAIKALIPLLILCVVAVIALDAWREIWKHRK